MEERLDNIEQKLDLIIKLLKPVNAHAPFVDDLKTACQNSRILRSMVPIRDRPMTPPLAIRNGDDILTPVNNSPTDHSSL